MSTTDSGAHVCDVLVDGEPCGHDLGNAGLHQALVVTTLDDVGLVRTLHACRVIEPAPTEDNPDALTDTGHAAAVLALFDA